MKYIIYFLIATVLLTYSTNAKSQTTTPEKRYPIYLTLSQIQILVTKFQSPGDVTPNQSDKLLNDIISQANAQLTPPKKDTTKLKK